MNAKLEVLYAKFETTGRELVDAQDALNHCFPIRINSKHAQKAVARYTKAQAEFAAAKRSFAYFNWLVIFTGLFGQKPRFNAWLARTLTNVQFGRE